MKELLLWKFIDEALSKKENVILLCVLESNGSSPGRQGFKMAVTKKEMLGSIGGGMMEFKFVELAKEKLKEKSDEVFVRKQIHSKAAKINQSGMICSGEQTIFLYPIKLQDKKTIEKIIFCLKKNKNGEFKITHEGISFSEKIIPEKDFSFKMNSENDFEFIEKLGYKNQLFIIGGGHCALALAKLMSAMDFYIQLFEERKNLNTFLQNDFVHGKNIVADYSQLNKKIPSGKNHFVVIMSFGYRTDDVALRALIKKDFKYLGVLGSQSKMKQLFSEWRKDALPEDKLKNIFSPIGISIHSQTPEEIAISIAAEIIKVKNKIER
jgi:xanthine dehydrogenase accessory factor